MKRRKNISYKKILYELIALLSIRNHNNDYMSEYNRVIREVVKRIKEADFIVTGVNDEITVSSVEVYKAMSKVSGVISLCVTKYLKGEIAKANWAFIEHWKKLQIPKYEEFIGNRVFYRMRNIKEKEKKDFEISDLLHIPITKRGIIGNQRFSINGFPCCYASTSLYQCWEELRRPHLHSLYASGLLFTDNLKFLDLRLIRVINNERQLKVFMNRLPFIIACSIKTRDDEAVFKAEYIISQILLHTILNEKDTDGIIYSSMRKDYDYFGSFQNMGDCSRNENIVIPAKVTCEKDLFVDNLLKIMEISQPLNFEQEIIKGNIGFNKSNRYEDTLFGQMERLMMSTKMYKADKPHMLFFDNVSYRVKELNNNICLI